VVAVQTQPELLHVVHALGTSGGLPDLLDGRQQEADQHGDDGDHHEQFDERERAPAERVTSHRGILTRAKMRHDTDCDSMRPRPTHGPQRNDHTIPTKMGIRTIQITVYPSGPGVGNELFRGSPNSQGESRGRAGSGAAATKLDIRKTHRRAGARRPSILRPDRRPRDS